MNSYQKEQLEAFEMVREYLRGIKETEIGDLERQIAGYLAFRTEVADFLSSHFESICTDSCYRDRISACCSRDGIITFFADVVINALGSTDRELSVLEKSIRNPEDEGKCIYLSPNGCVWRIKPLVCEFFLCSGAKDRVFADNPEAEAEWEKLEIKKKGFSWPDRPVLFESLEKRFLSAGYDSPLMYMYKSPGLMRIRKNRM